MILFNILFGFLKDLIMNKLSRQALASSHQLSNLLILITLWVPLENDANNLTDRKAGAKEEKEEWNSIQDSIILEVAEMSKDEHAKESMRVVQGILRVAIIIRIRNNFFI